MLPPGVHRDRRDALPAAAGGASTKLCELLLEASAAWGRLRSVRAGEEQATFGTSAARQLDFPDRDHRSLRSCDEGWHQQPPEQNCHNAPWSIAIRLAMAHHFQIFLVLEDLAAFRFVSRPSPKSAQGINQPNHPSINP
jgi:hypothetical protein